MKKDFEPTRDLQDERVDASVSNLNPIPPQTDQGISPQSLGSEAFRKDHGLKYAYLSGAMYRGIASKELVIAMGRAGFMGFLGTGGLSLDDIEKNIIAIQQSLCANHAYGMNLVCNIDHPATEMATVELYLQYGIKCVEAAAFIRITPALVLFPARANKLWQLYHRYDSIEDIPEKTQLQIQEKFFKKTFDDVWTETRQHLLSTNRPDEVDNAEQNSKAKMARIFRWYFAHSMQLAFAGNHNERVNFQVHTGPALGAFNQWVKGTPLESWQNRHVAEIGEKIMRDTADLLTQKTRQLLAFNQRTPPDNGDQR